MGKIIPFLQNNKIPLLVTAIILLAAPPWFLWFISAKIKFVLVIVMLWLVRHRISQVSVNVWIVFIFLIAPLFIIFPLFRGWHGSGIIYSVCFIIACTVSMSEYYTALKYLTRIFAWILAISLPFWLLHVFVHQLPVYSTIDVTAMKGATVIMNNHIFFVTYAGLDFFRFYSVFDEPGVLGTLASFLLYANKYDFKKWYNWVILAGGFFSYSLAFYLLTFIGFLIISYKRKKNAIISLMFIIPLIAYSLTFLKDDDAFNQAIMYRLFEADSSDLVEGRTGDVTNSVFDEMVSSPDAFLGYGYNYLQSFGLINGASYKLFLLEYGLIGMLSMLLIYRVLMRRNNSLYAWGAYALIFASFLQRPQIWTDNTMLTFGCMIAGVTLVDHSGLKQNYIKQNGTIE